MEQQEIAKNVTNWFLAWSYSNGITLKFRELQGLLRMVNEYSGEFCESLQTHPYFLMKELFNVGDEVILKEDFDFSVFTEEENSFMFMCRNTYYTYSYNLGSAWNEPFKC